MRVLNLNKYPAIYKSCQLVTEFMGSREIEEDGAKKQNEFSRPIPDGGIGGHGLQKFAGMWSDKWPERLRKLKTHTRLIMGENWPHWLFLQLTPRYGPIFGPLGFYSCIYNPIIIMSRLLFELKFWKKPSTPSLTFSLSIGLILYSSVFKTSQEHRRTGPNHFGGAETIFPNRSARMFS